MGTLAGALKTHLHVTGGWPRLVHAPHMARREASVRRATNGCARARLSQPAPSPSRARRAPPGPRGARRPGPARPTPAPACATPLRAPARTKPPQRRQKPRIYSGVSTPGGGCGGFTRAEVAAEHRSLGRGGGGREGPRPAHAVRAGSMRRSPPPTPPRRLGPGRRPRRLRPWRRPGRGQAAGRAGGQAARHGRRCGAAAGSVAG
jgi:hypothetical protein